MAQEPKQSKRLTMVELANEAGVSSLLKGDFHPGG
jgi:hypothetical protein